MARRPTARSLAAFGRTTSSAFKRLSKAGIHDPELIMAGLWADLNKPPQDAVTVVPIQSIAHRCTNKCKGGAHVYDTPNPADVQIASATVQWLATAAGRAFYTKFLQELGVTIEYRPDVAAARKAGREKKHGISK